VRLVTKPLWKKPLWTEHPSHRLLEWECCPTRLSCRDRLVLAADLGPEMVPERLFPSLKQNLSGWHLSN